ncbi:mitochondrial 39-S ribosomal protein L47 (MRP-L47)-domain-containing protein [Lipomyces orientalis]|uniref:Mitochondrial 39-S ribosomal protein L47 (MRP-L47)-domain-containing protein n=1 Tax=Lipomyces orientalis TaxID=1233043 RepID=A0ACC3TSD2_9ASCO
MLSMLQARLLCKITCSRLAADAVVGVSSIPTAARQFSSSSAFSARRRPADAGNDEIAALINAQRSTYRAQQREKRQARAAQTSEVKKEIETPSDSRRQRAEDEEKRAENRYLSNKAKFDADYRRHLLSKPQSAGPVDKTVDVLVSSKKGEHVDLQPRPPITPSPGSVVTPDDHPLWQFYRSKGTCLTNPQVYDHLGRSWEIPELRRKGYEDLHVLWYVCLKELNILRTEMSALRIVIRPNMIENVARKYGEPLKSVRRSMANIRTVLLERYYAWENATEDFDLDSFVEELPSGAEIVREELPKGVKVTKKILNKLKEKEEVVAVSSSA